MSDALAISAVSYVLQYYLHITYASLSSPFGGAVKVSAVAPDIVQAEFAAGNAPKTQVNLFLHQVTPNAGWRNAGLPSLAADGISLLKNPPLALDLHYLLTAYGTSDWQAEGLLGYALLMLHQNPVIARSDITAALNAAPAYEPLNPISGFLGTSGLAEQLEMIKITPATLGREEMAWLWTALKADYRPTFPFQVSVVLILPQAQTVFSFPVLHRRFKAQAGPPAQIAAVQLPPGVQVPVSGTRIVVAGSSLGAAVQVLLANQRLGIARTISLTSADITYTSVTFTIPADTAADPVPAGLYDLSVILTDDLGNPGQSTNTLPLAVAPVITSAGPATVNAIGTVVPVSCSPAVFPAQNVSFGVGSAAAPALPFGSPPTTGSPYGISADSISFQFSSVLAIGVYLMRLEVDGIASAVNFTSSPPAITGPTVTI
jgi:hypothetical protein